MYFKNLVVAITVLASLIDAKESNVQKKSSTDVVYSPGVFISAETIKDLQSKARTSDSDKPNVSVKVAEMVQNTESNKSRDANIEQNQLSSSHDQVTFPSGQGSNNVPFIQNQGQYGQQPAWIGQQQMYPGPQDQQQMFSNLQQGYPNQQQTYPNSQYSSLPYNFQQPIVNSQQQFQPVQQQFQPGQQQQFLPNQQQQLLSGQQQFYPNQVQTNYPYQQQPYPNNQQQMIPNQQQPLLYSNQPLQQQPYPNNQQQMIPNQQQPLVYPNQPGVNNLQPQLQTQPQFIVGQTYPTNTMYQNGQAFSPNQQPLGSPALQTIVPNSVNVAPLSSNSGVSPLYAVVPVNTGQNLVTVPSSGPSYVNLVPVQQTPQNQVFALKERIQRK